MKNPWIFLVALAFAGAAHAQLYKWVDKDGKTRYGDTPPAGVKATAIGAPASGTTPAASSGAAKDAKSAPLTPAEQEQQYRKRQQEANKESEKQEQESKDKAAKADACARSKEYLTSLESGQRIARTSPSGERYFMEDDQRAQEAAKTRQTMQQVCAN